MPSIGISLICKCLPPVQQKRKCFSSGRLRPAPVQVSVGQAIQVLRGIPAITGIPGMTGREMVFITTKAGYMSQQQWLPLVQQKKVKEDDVIKGQHCIHPECLKASLERSLQAMNIETVGPCMGAMASLHGMGIQHLHPGQALVKSR